MRTRKPPRRKRVPQRRFVKTYGKPYATLSRRMLGAGPAVTSDGMHCLSPSLRQDDTIPLGDRTFSALSASILVVIISLPVLGQEWPAVEPVTQSFEVNVAAGLVAFDLPIKSAAGSVLYRLSCRGGSVKALDELTDSGTINWVGPLMCLLNLGNGAPSEDSLLAEDASPPWYTRGQFTTSDLVGACGRVPRVWTESPFPLARLRSAPCRKGPGTWAGRIHQAIHTGCLDRPRSHGEKRAGRETELSATPVREVRRRPRGPRPANVPDLDGTWPPLVGTVSEAMIRSHGTPRPNLYLGRLSICQCLGGPSLRE